jgi:phage shock protein C
MKEKKLTRSANDRMLAGVAGGLAEYLEIDPVIIRLLFVIVALFGGGFIGLFIYVVLWIIMPEAAES